MFKPPLTDDQKKQGAVLQMAHRLLEADSGMKIGDALAKAVGRARNMGYEVPQGIQDAMAVSLFKVVTGGFPSDVEA